jgi:PD-(D/E)XK nuclease superfamily
MEWLTDLPPNPEEIKMPNLLSVTRLATSGSCILKAIVPTAVCPIWPPSPEVEFGRLTHSLMDLAAKGQIQFTTLGDPRPVEEALHRLLENERITLARSPSTRDYADLRVAFSQREWRRRTSLAVDRTLELLRSPLTDNRESMRQAKPTPLERALRTEGFAASEVPLESKNLRLQGRVDFLRVSEDAVVEVSDFKSGNVLNDEGEVDEVTSLQLRLYGLAILELVPGARLQLKVVSRGGISNVSFSAEDIERTKEWLAQRLLPVRENQLMEANEIAIVGPQCRGCRARAVCPKYRTSVTELWKRQDVTMRLPLDIAGQILEVEPSAAAATTIKLTDLAGRVVKIHRLRPIVLPTTFEKSVFWFFNLATSEVPLRNGKWRHPRNFHELPASPLERRAWTLKAYRDPIPSQKNGISG